MIQEIVWPLSQGMPVMPVVVPLMRQGFQEYLRGIDREVMIEETWLASMLDLYKGFHRYEIEYWEGETLIGVAVVAKTIDFHVGPCVCVLTQYVIPQFRGRAGIARKVLAFARNKAREDGVGFMSWSHQLDYGTQLLKYRRVYGRRSECCN